MNCFKSLQKKWTEKPTNVALTGIDGQEEKTSLSYQQLRIDINIIRHALIESNVKAGDAVLISFSLCPESLVIILACLSIGALAVPVNPLASKKSIVNILEDIKPAIVIAENIEFEGILNGVKSEQRTYLYSNLYLEFEGGGESEHLQDEINFSIESYQPVLLMHTSGSTGTPRKILYNFPQLILFMEKHDFLYRQFSDVKGKQVYDSDLIVTLPLHHFGGFCLCLQGLLMGRSVHLLKSFLPQDYLSLALKKKVSLLMMVSSMYERLLERGEWDDSKVDINYCITMGEPCSESLALAIQQKLKAKVFSTYGLSECQTGIGHAQVLIDNNRVPAGSCGQQLFGESRLINAAGEQSNKGELWVRNETTFPCYASYAFNQEKLQRGWFKTGDLLRRDKFGNYYHCGRKDNMFIVNGKNIYPLELETIFHQHPAVEQAMIVPLLTVTGKTIVGVLIKWSNDFRPPLPDKGELIDYYLSKGNVYAAPSWVSITRNFPLNATGKVDRLKCQALLQNEYETHYYKIAS